MVVEFFKFASRIVNEFIFIYLNNMSDANNEARKNFNDQAYFKLFLELFCHFQEISRNLPFIQQTFSQPCNDSVATEYALYVFFAPEFALAFLIDTIAAIQESLIDT